MLYIATLYAFDAMSIVQTQLCVRAYPDDPEEQSSIVFECTTAVPGIGETDPRLWAKDALIATLEAI